MAISRTRGSRPPTSVRRPSTKKTTKAPSGDKKATGSSPSKTNTVQKSQSDLQASRSNSHQMKEQRIQRADQFKSSGQLPTFRGGFGGNVLGAKLHAQVSSPNRPQNLQSSNATGTSLPLGGEMPPPEGTPTPVSQNGTPTPELAPTPQPGTTPVATSTPTPEATPSATPTPVPAPTPEGTNTEVAPQPAPPFREVINDPDHVNANLEPAELQAIEQQVQVNQAQVEQKLQTLTPEQQQQYADVQGTVQNDPPAELALQEMLLDDRLPGATTNTNGENLLQSLSNLSNQDVAAGIDKQALVADTVQELHNPAAIAQRSRNTCGPTSATVHLANSNPAEYTRLVGGLASPEGTVNMANGDTLTREPGAIGNGDGTNRTQSNRLLASSLMEYANPLFDYNNANDAQQAFGRDITTAGISAPEMDKILQGLNGESFNVDLAVTPWGKEALVQRVQEQTNNGEMVPIMMKWQNGNHYVNVTNVDDQFAYITNPWGTEERIPIDEFQSRIMQGHFQQ